MAQKVAPFPTLQQSSENSPHLHLSGTAMPAIDQLQVLERLKQLRVWQQQQQESLLQRQQEQLARLRDEEDGRRRQVGVSLTGDRSSTAASSSSSQTPTLFPDIKPSQPPVADSTQMCSSDSATSSPPLHHHVPDIFSSGVEADSMSPDSSHSSPSCRSVEPNDTVPRAVKVASIVPGVDGTSNEATTSGSSLSADSGLAADESDECQGSTIQEAVLRDEELGSSEHGLVEEQHVQVCQQLLWVWPISVQESSNGRALIGAHWPHPSVACLVYTCMS